MDKRNTLRRIMVTHKHHIIPLHSGGTDDPDNLIELTIEEHAIAHKKLYETYGNEFDRLAYLALSGHIGKEEINLEKMRLGAIKGGKRGGKVGGKATVNSHGPQIANGPKALGKSNVESGHLRRISSLGGKKTGLKNLAINNVKVISLHDGLVTIRNKINHFNKKDKSRIGTWVIL
jgi:hypothetical protein